MRVQVFRSRAFFRRGLVPENKCKSLLSITTAVERPQVVLQRRGAVTEAVVLIPHLLVSVPTCSEAMVPVPNIVVPVPQGCGVPVHFWYRYHTYWYRYQHAISAGLDHWACLLGLRAHHFKPNQYPFVSLTILICSANTRSYLNRIRPTLKFLCPVEQVCHIFSRSNLNLWYYITPKKLSDIHFRHHVEQSNFSHEK